MARQRRFLGLVGITLFLFILSVVEGFALSSPAWSEEDSPTHPRANKYLKQADRQMRASQYQEAVESFQTALKYQRYLPEAYEGMADAYEKLWLKDEAKKARKMARRLRDGGGVEEPEPEVRLRKKSSRKKPAVREEKQPARSAKRKTGKSVSEKKSREGAEGTREGAEGTRKAETGRDESRPALSEEPAASSKRRSRSADGKPSKKPARVEIVPVEEPEESPREQKVPEWSAPAPSARESGREEAPSLPEAASPARDVSRSLEPLEVEKGSSTRSREGAEGTPREGAEGTAPRSAPKVSPPEKTEESPSVRREAGKKQTPARPTERSFGRVKKTPKRPQAAAKPPRTAVGEPALPSPRLPAPLAPEVKDPALAAKPPSDKKPAVKKTGRESKG